MRYVVATFWFAPTGLRPRPAPLRRRRAAAPRHVPRIAPTPRPLPKAA